MPSSPWPDRYIEWGRLVRPMLVSVLEARFRRFQFLLRIGDGVIARDLAEGGTRIAFELAHRLQPFRDLFADVAQFRRFLQPYAYRQALRLLPEHPDVTPWFNELT